MAQMARESFQHRHVRLFETHQQEAGDEKRKTKRFVSSLVGIFFFFFLLPAIIKNMIGLLN